MARPTTVKTLPRIVGVAGGGDEGRRIEGQHRREDKENQVKTLPLATIVAGGARQKAKTNTKWKGDTTHSPVRGGRCLAENAYQKRKQNNVHHKGKKTKHTVLCYCVSSQLTLAAPRLGAEEGVGRTTKKTNTKNLQSRASV